MILNKVSAKRLWELSVLLILTKYAFVGVFMYGPDSISMYLLGSISAIYSITTLGFNISLLAAIIVTVHQNKILAKEAERAVFNSRQLRYSLLIASQKQNQEIQISLLPTTEVGKPVINKIFTNLYLHQLQSGQYYWHEGIHSHSVVTGSLNELIPHLDNLKTQKISTLEKSN